MQKRIKQAEHEVEEEKPKKMKQIVEGGGIEEDKYANCFNMAKTIVDGFQI